ncbi:hypothetical protein CEXT_104901 [Caerostris extrusa]|uniref:Uncharacterized protein n=1 Tax=Caerostris extrusa TaxID=172846 RepID=A0AAV4XSH5_CAEEX|nr:hypothetical protein CEXT_104901 [Caerostris extrusa]
MYKEFTVTLQLKKHISVTVLVLSSLISPDSPQLPSRLTNSPFNISPTIPNAYSMPFSNKGHHLMQRLSASPRAPRYWRRSSQSLSVGAKSPHNGSPTTTTTIAAGGADRERVPPDGILAGETL